VGPRRICDIYDFFAPHINVLTYLLTYTWKLAKKHCHYDSRLYFFSQKVINRWNSLSQEDADAQSINCFKNRLEKRRTRQMDFFKRLSLLVLSAARKDNQELVHQDGTSKPGAAVPSKHPANIGLH